MKKYVTKNNVIVAAIVAVVATLGAAWEYGPGLVHAASPATQPASAVLGSDAKVDFLVQAVKEFPADSQGGVQALLNNKANFRDPDNFTVVIKKGAGVATPAVGTHLIVSGTVTKYKDKPEIVVTKSTQITNASN